MMLAAKIDTATESKPSNTFWLMRNVRSMTLPSLRIKTKLYRRKNDQQIGNCAGIMFCTNPKFRNTLFQNSMEAPKWWQPAK